MTSIFAVLSCFASFVTFLIFIVDLKRFQYPERSIFFLSFCTLAVSGVYVYGTFYDGYACGSKSVERVPLVTQGMDNLPCTLMAVFHYYFSTAMYLWWLNLCFSWFLVTTMRWGEAPVGRVFSSYFHIIAWGLPSLMVIAVLVMNGVDGDLFSSICSVGNLQPSILFNFVVLPQAAALGELVYWG
uniref:G_PROTEIN_RECEP_F2_4 domain-containing protein n=1 Tax=Panagrellus redivivus TaxID=6233 RepID=A0A7E4ZR52_PANRE